MLRLFSGPTHREFGDLKFVYILAVEGRRLRFVLCETTGGTAFSLAFFTEDIDLYQAKKRCWKFLCITLNGIHHSLINCILFFVIRCMPTEESPHPPGEDLGGGRNWTCRFFADWSARIYIFTYYLFNTRRRFFCFSKRIIQLICFFIILLCRCFIAEHFQATAYPVPCIGEGGSDGIGELKCF